MRMRTRRVLALSTVMMWTLVFSTAILSMPAKAASAYDGTYDFTTTYSSETYTQHAFLTITDGQISNVYVDSLYNPSGIPSGVGSGGDTDAWWYTFTGSVDLSGNAQWLGGCLLAAGNMAYTYVGVFHLDGTGSGTWSKVDMEHGTWSVKKSGGLSLGFGSISGVTPIVSVAVIVVSIVVIVAVAAPLRPPIVPGTPSAPPGPPAYQPSIVGETGTLVPSMPDGAIPVGGVGLQYASPPSSGKPLPPKDYFSKTSQNSPRCPIHGDVALVPHYFRTDGSDPGSWFCPRCDNYPWGRS
jgi:hypothetical protein